MLGRALARHSLWSSPQHYIVHVTGRCLHRCGHCFTREETVAELPLARLRALGREMGRVLWLDIGGGEPFLREDLPEIVGGFQADMVQLPTSGATPRRIVALTREILAATRAQVTVSVSLDGEEPFHDNLRGTPGASGKAWETLEALLAVGHPRLSVKVNTVLMAQNAGQVLPLMKQVRQAGPDFHSVILHRGQGRDAGVGLPPLDELTRLGAEILKQQARYDYGQGPLTSHILRRYHRALWELSLQTLRTGRQAVPCLGGRAHLTVWSDGQVAPCELLPSVGDLTRQSLSEILAGERLNQARAEIRAGHCACTHNCALLDSVLFNPVGLGRLLLGA